MSDAARGIVSKNLVQRILSAAVLAPVVLLATWYGGAPFALIILLIAVLAFVEWVAMTRGRGGGERAIWLGFGALYVVLPTAALIVLRGGDPAGWVGIAFIFAIVWATDTAAYFGGRSIGGPKLWRRVSPGKTWSGALTGFVAGIAAGVLVSRLGAGTSVPAAAGAAALLSIAAQLGDLLESAVKRRFAVKDSGSVIPGHGGVLDRIDSLYGAAVAAWLLAAAGLSGQLFRSIGGPG